MPVATSSTVVEGLGPGRLNETVASYKVSSFDFMSRSRIPEE